MSLLADPNDANHRIQHVIHHHAPAGHVAKRGTDFLTYISEGGTSAGICPRHAAIADRGKQHSDHRDQDGGDNVSMTALAQHAEHRHRRHRLNDDYPVQNEIPKRERSSKTRPRADDACRSGCHSRVLDYAP